MKNPCKECLVLPMCNVSCNKENIYRIKTSKREKTLGKIFSVKTFLTVWGVISGLYFIHVAILVVYSLKGG